MTVHAKPPVIADVISQHAEEASFLWLLRDGAVRDPHYSLKDLAKLDGRVEAHLDGLRIAGEAGWEVMGNAAEPKGGCRGGQSRLITLPRVGFIHQQITV